MSDTSQAPDNTTHLNTTVNAWQNDITPVSSETGVDSVTYTDNFPPLPSSDSNSSLQSTTPAPTDTANNAASRSGTQNKVPSKVTARKALPPQPRLTIHCDDVQETRKAIDKALETIPISQARNFSSSVRVWFPNEECQRLATVALKKAGVLEQTARVSAEVMSKVELRFVPVDSLPRDATTEQCRKFCLEKLKAKNEVLKTCKDLSIVYFKRMQADLDLATVVLKLPVQLKDKLMADGRVFFQMSSIRVSHRVHIKRCPHCQALGHYPDKCPKRSLPETCMYCAGQHSTEDCTLKNDTDKHCCVNCTKNASLSSDIHPHHAGSPKCPTYKEHYDRMAKNYRQRSTLHSNTAI